MSNSSLKSMWYDYKDGNLILFKKENNSIRKENAPFKPYCFIEKGKEKIVEYYAKKLDLQITINDCDLQTLDHKPLMKVEAEYPKAIALIRDKVPIETFEADIPYVRRVMIDCDWKITTDYKKAYWDIECDDSKSNGKIVAISLVSKDKSECFMGEEKEILLNFLEALQDYDMLVGYNSDVYDLPKLLSALKKYKLPHELKEIRWHDLMWSIKSMRQRMLASWSLDYVAKTIIGEGRVHYEKKISESTKQEIKERCIRDAELLLMIDDAEQYTNTDIAKAHISYLFPDEVSVVSRCVDTLLLKQARKLGYALPNKPEKIEETHHSGALVLQPLEPFKVYKNVAVVDYVSLYPNIIINYKISPDDEKRLYTDILKELLETRVWWKRRYQKTGDAYAKSMQYALKIVLNAFYGVLSSSTFRIRRVDLGDEVAKRGREILSFTVDGLQKLGYKVIYGDTDSLFVQIEDITEEKMQELEEVVNKLLYSKLGVDIKADAEKAFSKLYFAKKAGEQAASKKKYAGYIVYKKGIGKVNEFTVVGFEAVRSDYPEAARMLQKTLIDLQLREVGKDVIRQAVLDFRKALFAGEIDAKDLVLSKTLTKKNYKVKTQHSVAAEKAKMLGLNDAIVGDKVHYVYTKRGVEPYHNNVTDLDYDYYWDRIFAPLIERTIGMEIKGKDDKLDLYL